MGLNVEDLRRDKVDVERLYYTLYDVFANAEEASEFVIGGDAACDLMTTVMEEMGMEITGRSAHATATGLHAIVEWLGRE